VRGWPRRAARSRLGNKPLVVGFFHPYCNSAGGGERVLWKARRALRRGISRPPLTASAQAVEELLARSAAHIIIYTGDVDATRAQILSKGARHVRARAHIHIAASPPPLRSR
jgi:alpha-1,2-mannosyltransferase